MSKAKNAGQTDASKDQSPRLTKIDTPVILYCTELYYMILHSTTILYYTAKCIVSQYTVLYCILLCYTILYYVTLYDTILCSIVNHTMLYSTGCCIIILYIYIYIYIEKCLKSYSIMLNCKLVLSDMKLSKMSPYKYDTKFYCVILSNQKGCTATPRVIYPLYGRNSKAACKAWQERLAASETHLQ